MHTVHRHPQFPSFGRRRLLGRQNELPASDCDPASDWGLRVRARRAALPRLVLALRPVAEGSAGIIGSRIGAQLRVEGCWRLGRSAEYRSWHVGEDAPGDEDLFGRGQRIVVDGFTCGIGHGALSSVDVRRLVGWVRRGWQGVEERVGGKGNIWVSKRDLVEVNEEDGQGGMVYLLGFRFSSVRGEEDRPRMVGDVRRHGWPFIPQPRVQTSDKAMQRTERGRFFRLHVSMWAAFEWWVVVSFMKCAPKRVASRHFL